MTGWRVLPDLAAVRTICSSTERQACQHRFNSVTKEGYECRSMGEIDRRNDRLETPTARADEPESQPGDHPDFGGKAGHGPAQAGANSSRTGQVAWWVNRKGRGGLRSFTAGVGPLEARTIG